MRTKFGLALLLLTGFLAASPDVRAAAQATAAANSLVSVPATQIPHPILVRLAWQFGADSETFRSLPCFAMLDFLHARGVHHVVLSGGQALSGDRTGATVRPDMPVADLDALLAQFKADKLDAVSYGVVTFSGDETANRTIFEFCRKLRVKYVLATLPADDATITLLDTLANEYKVTVAFVVGKETPASLDNGLMKRVGVRSKRIAFSLDTADLAADPAGAVARLQTYAERLVEVRLSDHDTQGREVALGAGVTGTSEVLAQLRVQGFKGVCAIHYRGADGGFDGTGWAESVNAFSRQVTALGPPPAPKPPAATEPPAKQP